MSDLVDENLGFVVLVFFIVCLLVAKDVISGVNEVDKENKDDF